MALSKLRLPAYITKPRMVKTVICAGAIFAAADIACAAYEAGLEKRMEALFPASGQWEVSGAFPLLDAFYIGTVRTMDNPFVTVRHAFFFGLPFQYIFGSARNARFDSVVLSITDDKASVPAFGGNKGDETLYLYNAVPWKRTEFPNLSVTLQTPLGIFKAQGAGVIDTDELDNNIKTIKAHFELDDEHAKGKIALRGKLSADGTLNGQVILESATFSNAVGMSGKRIGGILDFEKSVGTDWIISGEGSAGFISILGKNLSGAEIMYLDDKETERTVLLKANDMSTGVRTDIDLTFDKDGRPQINTDTSPTRSRNAETGE